MSTYGIFHTLLSLPPMAFGVLALLQHRSFDPRTWSGKWYAISMFAATVSSFGFIPMRGFTPAQGITIAPLAFLLPGLFTLRGQLRAPGYVQIICLTTTYLLLMVAATTESLTRLPVGKPFAAGPDDAALIPVRIALLIGFGLAIGIQVAQLKKQRTARA